jgi:uncharacterized protein
MKIVWLLLGHLFVTLGFIGIFLPILPTTPFLILASACYSKGSARFENWIINHPRFGKSLREWRSYRVIRPRAKIMSTGLMSLSVGYVLIFTSAPLLGKIGIATTMMCVAFYILTRPSSPIDDTLTTTPASSTN